MNKLEKQGYKDYKDNKPIDLSFADNYDYITGYEVASVEDYLKTLQL